MSFDVFKFANFINKQFVKCLTYVNFVIFHLYGTHEQFVIPVNLLYPRMNLLRIPHILLYSWVFFYNCTVSYFESFQNQSMISFSGDIKLNK